MGISIWQLLILLVIVLLLFGTKKLRNLGTDLGSAIKGFRSAVKDGGQAEGDAEPEVGEAAKLESNDGTVIDSEVASKERDRA